jgi:hypothetical protein
MDTLRNPEENPTIKESDVKTVLLDLPTGDGRRRREVGTIFDKIETATWTVLCLGTGSGVIVVFLHTASSYLLLPANEVPLHIPMLVAVELSAIASTIKQMGGPGHSDSAMDVAINLLTRSANLLKTIFSTGAFVSVLSWLASNAPLVSVGTFAIQLPALPVHLYGVGSFVLTTFGSPVRVTQELYHQIAAAVEHLAQVILRGDTRVDITLNPPQNEAQESKRGTKGNSRSRGRNQ